MRCESCQGTGKMHRPLGAGGGYVHTCQDCMGSGIAYCCDTAGCADNLLQLDPRSRALEQSVLTAP